MVPEKKGDKKGPGKLPPRPTTSKENSREAAADMLKKFFNSASDAQVGQGLIASTNTAGRPEKAAYLAVRGSGDIGPHKDECFCLPRPTIGVCLPFVACTADDARFAGFNLHGGIDAKRLARGGLAISGCRALLILC